MEDWFRALLCHFLGALLDCSSSGVSFCEHFAAVSGCSSSLVVAAGGSGKLCDGDIGSDVITVDTDDAFDNPAADDDDDVAAGDDNTDADAAVDVDHEAGDVAADGNAVGDDADDVVADDDDTAAITEVTAAADARAEEDNAVVVNVTDAVVDCEISSVVIVAC